MHIKRYEAATMAEALEQVRAELGPDALILSSRTIRPGQGRFGFLARERIEVQAAIERSVRPDRSASTIPADESISSQPSGAREPGPDAGEFRAVVADLRRQVTRIEARESFEDEVRSELRGLRAAFSGVLGQKAHEQGDPAVEELARRGFDWVHAESLVRESREASTSDRSGSLSTLLRKRLEARMTPPRAARAGEVRMLVGAAGVGKTTSLAKIAARNEEGEREVALVSLDQFRIGATDQLRRYAEFLDAPFCEVSTAESLPSVVDRYRGHSVLVDSAGRDRRMASQNDLGVDAVSVLRDRFGKRLSIDLVIDASAKRDVQRAQLRRFASLAPDRLIVAKADECDSLLDVANLLLDEGCPPLCWLGTGQRVPEDFVEADADRLVTDVLGRAA